MPTIDIKSIIVREAVPQLHLCGVGGWIWKSQTAGDEMNASIIIRCFYCNTVLAKKHIDIDPLTGAMTIKVGECKPCMDEAWEQGMDADYDDEDDA